VKSVTFEGINHKAITDYAHFQVGSVNSAKNEYKNFNGQVTWIRLMIGKGSYLPD
jgi:hypothetical protein